MKVSSYRLPTVTVLLATPCAVHEVSAHSGLMCAVAPPLLYGDEWECPFVMVPASCGTLAGFAGAIVPICIVSGTAALVWWPFGDPEDGFTVVAAPLLIITTQATGTVVGAPFYVAKKVLWDAPRGIASFVTPKKKARPIWAP